MKAGQVLHHISLGLLALLSCALGVLNVVWIYHSSDGLTLGQIIFDVFAGCILLGLAVVLTIHARRNPNLPGFTDEYAETRRRYASQIGVIVGLVLFCVSLVAKSVFPAAFDNLIGTYANKQEAFFSGHMAGGVTFYIGIMIGWLVAYAKYR